MAARDGKIKLQALLFGKYCPIPFVAQFQRIWELKNCKSVHYNVYTYTVTLLAAVRLS